MTSIEEAKKRNEDRAINEAAAKMDRLKAEKSAITGAHLKQLAEEQAEDAQMVNIVVQAALGKVGDKLNADNPDRFASDCEALAHRLTTARRNREWTQIKAVLDAQNEREPNPVLRAAARRAGVELTFDEKPEPPRLVPG